VGSDAPAVKTAALNKILKEGPAMLNLLSRLRHDETGATAIEYGLIASLIAVVIIGAVTTVGTSLSTTFTNIANKLQ